MNRTVLNFITVGFEAQEFSKIPEPYKSFALASSLASNDATVFMRMIIFNFADQSTEEIVDRISNAHRLTLERNLNSKVVEFIKIFSDFSKKISRSKTEKNKFDLTEIDTLIKQLKTAPEYQMSVFLRNKITNHYIGEEMSYLLEKFDDNHPLQTYANIKPGNSFHVFAEEISFVGSLLKFEHEGIDRSSLTSWTLDAAANLNRLHQNLLIDIFTKFIPTADLSQREARVESPFIAKFEPLGMGIQMPLFAPEDFDIDELRRKIEDSSN